MRIGKDSYCWSVLPGILGPWNKLGLRHLLLVALRSVRKELLSLFVGVSMNVNQRLSADANRQRLLLLERVAWDTGALEQAWFETSTLGCTKVCEKRIAQPFCWSFDERESTPQCRCE